MDHISLLVSDLTKSQAFYDAILAPLGGKRAINPPGMSMYVNAKNGVFLAIAQKEGGHKDGMHFAFAAESSKQVDAWYEAAIKAGGKDNGKAGPRPNYGPHFYGAFVIDPNDGYHLECCFKKYEADPPKPRVYYFGGRGRGEQIRLLMHELDQPFDDVRLGRDEFVALQKRQGPLSFGSVPMLEEGKRTLVQGGAIMSYLAKKHGIYPSDPHDGAVADSVVLGAEDFRIKVFAEPTTKAKSSKDGKAEGEAAEITKAQESVKKFLSEVWGGRWEGQFERLLQAGTGFVVGSSLTHADIALFDTLDGFVTAFGPFFSGFDSSRTPNLAKFFSDMKSRPRIAKYIASRS